MRLLTPAVILIALSACAAPETGAEPGARADFFVAPDGSDANAGTVSKPFATVVRARDAVRELRAAEPGRKTPVVVLLRGGIYPLPETLRFGPEDAGTKDSPTVYRAYPKEQPVLSGGRKVKGWKTDGQGRWTVSLPDAKVDRKDPTCSEIWDTWNGDRKFPRPWEGKWEFSQLFVNGERRYRTRFPETGYVKVAANGPSDEFGAKFPGEGPNAVAFGGEPIRENWHNVHDIEFVLMNSWNTGRYRLSKIAGGVFWITGPGAGRAWWNGICPQRRYFLVNIKELLKPGTFYLDRMAGVLTYHPKAGETPANTEVIAPRVRMLVELRGDIKNAKWVQHLRFEDLTFAHANYNLVRGIPKGGRGLPQAELDVDAAIKAIGMRHCVFKACTVRNVGQYGLRIDMACKHNLVEDCEIYDLGGGGMWLGSTNNGGWGYHEDPPKGMAWSDEIAASHNTVRNCLIARGGRMHGGSVGFWIGQTHHNVVEHCEIADFYYTGMNIGWRWGFDSEKSKSSNHHNTIRLNHIHTIAQGVLKDLGAIYTLGESPGTVIHNNVLNDVHSFKVYQGAGLYTDYGSKHYVFENNLVYDTTDGAYHNHHSTDIVIRNNIFAFNNGNIKLTNSLPFTFTRNIVYWKQGYIAKGGAQIRGGRNLFWHARGKHGKWPPNDETSVIADPMFVDPDARDFRFKPGAPIDKIGFKPFDAAKAGRLPGFRKAAALPGGQKVMY